MSSALPDRFSAGKRQFWREFLALYQGMPELWDAHHVNYRNKGLRCQAYEQLQTKLREIQPNATRTEVGRRINIFRTNYRREQVRILKQKELGLHSDLCKPTLWFYDYMGFLQTQERFQHRTSKGRTTTANGRQKIGIRCAKEESAEPPDSVGNWPMKDTTVACYLPEPATPQSEETSLLSPKVEIIEADEGQPMHEMEHNDDLKVEVRLPDLPGSTEPTCSTHLEATSGPGNARNPSLSESSEVLAKSWAIQYEEMSPTQRILARKAIADILFEGCMGNLRINRGEPRNTVGSSFP